MQNLCLKTLILGKLTHNNLQLSVGKLQRHALPTFLTHDAADKLRLFIQQLIRAYF